MGNIVLTIINKRTPSADTSSTTQQAFLATVMDENKQLRAEVDSKDSMMDGQRDTIRQLKEQLAAMTDERDKALAKVGDLSQVLQGKEREIKQKDIEINTLLRKNAGLNGHDKHDISGGKGT
jgi:chromosome segregation ATPase